MKIRKHLLVAALNVMSFGLVLALVGASAPNAKADPIPPGWACNGTCGSDVADGVVPLSPIGSPEYQWVSTNGGLTGVGVLPTGSLGGETNGSTLATSVFTATANTDLNFYFDYVTSDGFNSNVNNVMFQDYGWAALFDSSNNLVAVLFTARTEPSGSIVPGAGMPAPAATLNPTSVLIGGGTTWSPLGSTSSGNCYGAGCGNTGWVNANYMIQNAGDYYLKVGVVNWADTNFDSGLAMDGVTINGQSITSTPEPGTMLLLALGAGSLALFRRRVQA